MWSPNPYGHMGWNTTPVLRMACISGTSRPPNPAIVMSISTESIAFDHLMNINPLIPKKNPWMNGPSVASAPASRNMPRSASQSSSKPCCKQSRTKGGITSGSLAQRPCMVRRRCDDVEFHILALYESLDLTFRLMSDVGWVL